MYWERVIQCLEMDGQLRMTKPETNVLKRVYYQALKQVRLF